MYKINEFNNSRIGQTLAAEKRDAADRKITLYVTTVIFVLCIAACKYAVGH